MTVREPRLRPFLAFSLSSPTTLPLTFSPSSLVLLLEYPKGQLFLAGAVIVSPLLPLSSVFTQCTPSSLALLFDRTTAHRPPSLSSLASRAASGSPLLAQAQARCTHAHHGGKYLLLLPAPSCVRAAPRRLLIMVRHWWGSEQTLEPSTVSLSLFSWACMHSYESSRSIRTQFPRDMVLLIPLQFFRCFLAALDNY